MSNPVVATGLDISQRWVLSNCSLLAGGAEMLARYRARSIVNPHKDFSNARKQDSIYSGLPLGEAWRAPEQELTDNLQNLMI